MRGRVWLVALWCAAVVLALLLSAANLFFGEINQDEGLYLYAAREVTRGRLPFIDFASTQGPVMAFVYAAAYPLVKLWGVGGGRLFTAALGFVGCTIAALLARRIAREGNRDSAALIAFILTGVNVYQSYFTVVVKTYALAGLLLTAAFLAFSFCEGRRGGLAAFGAGALSALAAGTRLSAVVAMPVIFIWLLLLSGRQARSVEKPLVGSHVHPGAWFATGCAATLLLIFLPFALRAPEALYFGLVEYHAGRSAGGVLPALAYKAGFISRVVQAYFVAIGLFLFYCLRIAWFKVTPRAPVPSEVGTGAGGRLTLPIWITVAAITAIHLLAPFPYDDYQVIVFPLFASALAASMTFGDLTVDCKAEGLVRSLTSLGLLLLCAAAAFSSPINQSWFVGCRDRIWWPIKTAPGLAQLKTPAVLIRSHSRPEDLLLTQDLYLAVEADRSVPPGLELGPFSYYPDWPRQKAERCHVLNAQMLRELLQTTSAPMAAFSEWALAIAAPRIVPLPASEQRELRAIVDRRYRVLQEYARFGQGETVLQVLVALGGKQSTAER